MIIDAKGLACPLPVVNTKKAIEGLTESSEITVLVDNDIAVQNLLKFASQKNYEAKSEKISDKEYQVLIKVKLNNEPIVATDSTVCYPDTRKNNTVVVLSANVMGLGDEKLGKILMKAFIFALAKQDQLPSTILLYNSGAFLSCEGSDSIEDLKSLEACGVNILTCGTCLDFYGLKEKLCVGSVTNMYEIVEIQEHASLIIRP